MKNFLRLDGLSILSVQYMYIDYKDYLADSLLAQNHVSVRFENEFSRDDSSYRIILCKVRKKDTAGFEKSMELLCNGFVEGLIAGDCLINMVQPLIVQMAVAGLMLFVLPQDGIVLGNSQCHIKPPYCFKSASSSASKS